MTFKQLDKFMDKLQDYTYTCSCGHRIVIGGGKSKEICYWCGRYVYKDKKEEFKERLEYARKNCR